MKVQLETSGWVEYDATGQGKPVVLLHAFPLSRAMWRPQVEALQGECRLVVPDLRGFGGTGPFTGAPSVEAMADDVAALLEALAVRKPVVLGGLSMGGYVALAFARRHPTRLRALVLADTRAEPDTPEGKANRNQTIAFAQTHSAAEVIEQMLPKLLGEETRRMRPEVGEEVRQIAAAQSPAAIVAALQALRDRPDARPGLGVVRVPALVVVGGDDTLTPPAVAQALANGIPGAHLVTIGAAGHLSNLEQPAAFNDAVRSFLRGLP
jgi:pimeloyl-ACP methyl ester carboxylesterase